MKHPGGRPAALPRLHQAAMARLYRTPLPCAGCDNDTEYGYAWPHEQAAGYYILMPQCPACAAETVRRSLAYTAAVPPHEVVRLQDAGHEVVLRDGLLIVE